MTFHKQPDEKVIVEVRKHWFLFLKDILGTLFIGILPLAILVFIARYLELTALFSNTGIWVFAFALWFLVIWMALATTWTNYYLDTWVVTDRRIVYIEQMALFRRKVVTLRMERIQDVSTEVSGIIETLLHFGTLRVQTAGPTGEFSVIEGIPYPSRVRDAILERVDTHTDTMTAIYKQASTRHDTHSE